MQMQMFVESVPQVKAALMHQSHSPFHTKFCWFIYYVLFTYLQFSNNFLHMQHDILHSAINNIHSIEMKYSDIIYNNKISTCWCSQSLSVFLINPRLPPLAMFGNAF